MKVAPITVTEVAVVGGVVILGYLAYKAWSSLPDSLGDAYDIALNATAEAVDARKPQQDKNELSLGGIQEAVSDAVRRGQEAGASNFFSAYIKGIFL